MTREGGKKQLWLTSQGAGWRLLPEDPPPRSPLTYCLHLHTTRAPTTTEPTLKITPKPQIELFVSLYWIDSFNRAQKPWIEPCVFNRVYILNQNKWICGTVLNRFFKKNPETLNRINFYKSYWIDSLKTLNRINSFKSYWIDSFKSTPKTRIESIL